MRRAAASLFVVAVVVANGALVVASCSSFDEEPTDGGVSAEAAGEAEGGDATVALDGSNPPAITCVEGTTKPPAGLAVQQLFAPQSEGYPFGLSTDATHVIWIVQSPGDAAFDPIGGNGNARVLRVPKTGATTAQELARDQPGAVAVQVDEGFAYWTTWDGATAQMYRVTTVCSAGCPAPEPVVTFPAGNRVVKLLRFAPGVLVAQGESGAVFFVRPKEAPVRILTTGTFPGLAATSAHLYASSELVNATVQRSTVAASPVIEPNYLSVPPPDGGQMGVGHLAADCTRLWMTQYFYNGKVNVYTHDFARPGSFEFVLQSDSIVNDVVADATYGYAALAGAGVIVIDPKAKKSYPVRSGDVGRLAIDADGVYFGERGDAQRGTIFMVRK